MAVMKRIAALQAAGTVALVVLAAAFTGCDSAMEPAAPRLVIEGYLIEGRTIEGIRVTESQTLDRPYGSAGIHGARVEITVDGQVLALVESPGSSGLYRDPGSHRVASGKTYALRVEHGGRVATGRTTVPDHIELLPSSSVHTGAVDTIRYLGSEVFLEWTPIERRKFVVGFVSIDQEREKIERDFGDEFEDEVKEVPDTAFVAAFNKVNSAEVPWIVFNYFGNHMLRVYAADDAYYDFVRTREQDPMSLIDPLSNITGGLGVFGSASVAEVHVFVRK
jgi:hypothetical protein